MKLRELLNEAPIAQQIGNAARSTGASVRQATDAVKSAGQAATSGTGDFVSGFKQGFGSPGKMISKAFTPSTKSPFDDVDPYKMRDIIDNLLSGKQLDNNQLSMLKNLRTKL